MLGFIQTVLTALIGAAGPVILYLIQSKKQRKDIAAENRKLIADNQECLSEQSKTLAALTVELTRHGSGMKILMRRHMEERYEQYMNQRCITAHQLHDFEESYSLYHDEGGNGVATRWFDEIKNLPLVSETPRQVVDMERTEVRL